LLSSRSNHWSSKKHVLGIIAKGYTDIQVEAGTGVPARTVKSWRQQTGTAVPRGHPPEVRAEAERLIAAGYDNRHIEHHTGVPRRTIVGWR
jgi:hypothetical protein